MSGWIVGEVGVISLAATSPAGLPVDPSGIRITVKSPGAESTTYTYGVDAGLVRDSDGVYHIHVTFDAVGRWSWRWDTDTPEGIAEGSVNVKRSLVI